MSKNLKTRIICTASGQHEMLFFAENSSGRIFLFRTNYYDRRIVDLYRSGISVDILIHTKYPKRIGKNPFGGVRLQKVRDHVLRVLRDIERETGSPIFRQTQKRLDASRRSAA